MSINEASRIIIDYFTEMLQIVAYANMLIVYATDLTNFNTNVKLHNQVKTGY